LKVGVSKDALNLNVIDSLLIQSRAETPAKGVPTEPRTVDVLRNISPGQVVQIEWSQHFLSSENPAFTYRRITRFVLCQNLAE
jgi:hypothetical protein